MEIEDHCMDEEADLVQVLVLEAARIMEDTSPALAMRLPTSRPDREMALARLARAADAIHSLAVATQALSRLQDERR